MKKKLCLRAAAAAMTVTLLASCTPSSPVEPSEYEPVINPEEHLVQAEGGYLIYSPDKKVVMTLVTGDTLYYCLDRAEENGMTQWVRPSRLGVKVGSTDYGSGAELVSADVEYIKEDRELMGNQSVVKCRCLEAVFTFSKDDKQFTLETRVYNDGIAFRYLLPEAGNAGVITEKTTYALRQDVSECWYSVYSGALGTRDYESLHEAHSPDDQPGYPIYNPLTAIVGDNEGYIALMEGDLNDSYPGTVLTAEGDATYGTTFMSTASFSNDKEIVTGWRLVNIADDLNGLVNNYNIYTLAALPDESLYGDASWIEPGRSTWSWVAEGLFGELGWGGIPTPSMMERYINVAAELGFEYNIIDDGWPKWENYKEELTSLGAKGAANNVKQILWGGITSGTAGFNKMQNEAEADEYIQFLVDTGMSGAKIDFWWDESNTYTTELQQYILKKSAENQLVIDFHGCNKNTGFNITYPNELNREGIHGGEYFQMPSADVVQYATLINSQLFTRYLCGHADWTPGTYNAMEIGSIICMDSPLMVIASKPEDILNSPAVELIKSIPTVWDRTYVMSDSRIGSYSSYAKEKDGVWFVGGVASDTVSGAKITLSEFLPEGEYTAEVWYDTASGMKSKTLTVTNGDTIEIGDLAAGQGYAVRLSMLTLSRYGGKIEGAVTVSAPDNATVKYTVDGSDPMTSDTAVKCGGSIELSGSCVLKVAITDGEGKGSMVTARFNKIE